MIDRAEARARAHELVSKMTLEERAGQLRFDAPAIDRLGIPAYNWWSEALHGVARAGTATVFPQAIALAAMFDEDFMGKIGDIIATEGRAKYNGQAAKGDRDIYKGLTFWSPNINIFRDPRWGRGHETYGEDPCLTARLGVRFIKGLQGEGKYLKAAACAKHFAVHSGPEGLRHEFDAVVSKKDMAETYLPAFEAAVTEGKVEAVMGAYNRVNGEPACGSKTLLRDILRGQWGFEGHVTSDCWAICDFHLHHKVTASASESAALAISNGCDLNCGTVYRGLMEAYAEGLVTEAQITEACERLFTSRCMLGMFADDCDYDAIPYTACDTDEHAAAALTAAERSMVLLHNDGILPLDASKIRTIAVIGPNANSVPALEGNYCGTSSRYVTFLEGIRAYACARGIRVLYSQGSALSRDRVQNLGQADDRLAEAALCAENADIVIACVGLDATLEGEQGDASNADVSGDKRDLLLPQSQRRLMDTLLATGKPLVTVVAAGSSLNVPAGNAQLLAWYPGQAGGTALARLLFGEVNPSGRLPLTFYEDVADLPPFTDYAMAGRTYRYFTGKPLYPFGYGLSYTTFKADSLHLELPGRAEMTVTNTGSVAGETVVQIYAKHQTSPLAPPNPALIGFARTRLLQPGERCQVEIPLVKTAFSLVDEQGKRVSERGVWKVYGGLYQPDARSAELTGVQSVCVEVEM